MHPYFQKAGNAKTAGTWSVRSEAGSRHGRRWNLDAFGTRPIVRPSTSWSASSPSATTSLMFLIRTAQTTTLSGTTMWCLWTISCNTPASLAWKWRTPPTPRRRPTAYPDKMWRRWHVPIPKPMAQMLRQCYLRGPWNANRFQQHVLHHNYNNYNNTKALGCVWCPI